MKMMKFEVLPLRVLAFSKMVKEYTGSPPREKFDSLTLKTPFFSLWGFSKMHFLCPLHLHCFRNIHPLWERLLLFQKYPSTVKAACAISEIDFFLCKIRFRTHRIKIRFRTHRIKIRFTTHRIKIFCYLSIPWRNYEAKVGLKPIRLESHGKGR